jgi:toxin secretion/phage lysis holin
MENFALKAIPAIAIAALTSWLGAVWQLVAFVFVMIIMDGMTGTLAGWRNEGLDSKRAKRGLFKKFGLICLFVLGYILDDVFNHYLTATFGADIPFNMPIGLVVSAWIIITEAISVCENLDKLGVPIPGWLLKRLKKTRDDLESKEEKKDGDVS